MDALTINYISASATAATAVGTLGLAVATYWLARKTNNLAENAEEELKLVRDQAAAAKQQSEIAEEALRASVRPLLANVVPGTPGPSRRGGEEQRVDDASLVRWETGQQFTLVVPVCNVGPGVARVRVAVLTANRQCAYAGPVLQGRVPAVIAASGGIDLIEFRSDDDPPDAAGALAHLVQSDMEIVLEVRYDDVSQRPSVTQFVMVRHSVRPLLVIRDVIPLGPPEYTSEWPQMLGGIVQDHYRAAGADGFEPPA